MLNSRNAKTTLNVTQYESFLRDNKKKTLDIVDVSPWGAVFGIRRPSGDWESYLAENATVLYRKIRKEKKGFFSKTKKVYASAQPS